MVCVFTRRLMKLWLGNHDFKIPHVFEPTHQITKLRMVVESKPQLVVKCHSICSVFHTYVCFLELSLQFQRNSSALDPTETQLRNGNYINNYKLKNVHTKNYVAPTK